MIDPQIQGLKAIFGELFVKLMGFTLEDEFEESLANSLCLFYHLDEGEEYEFIPNEEFLFLAWFLFDDANADDVYLIDEYLKRQSDALNLQETQICNALKESHLTLLQVLDFQPFEWISLRDLFLGEEFTVWESIGSEGITKGNLLFSRVLKLGSQRFLVGAGIFLDSRVLTPLTRFITDQYRQECEENDPINFQDFLKQNGELINWWIQAFQKGKSLQTMPSA